MYKLFHATLSIFIFTLLCVLLPGTVKSECVDTEIPKFRIFESISDLQSNKIYFDPSTLHSQGNYISFSNNFTIDVLARNTFVTFDSEHIRGVYLDNHQIQQIDEGAFLTMTCLSKLSLRSNKISVISKHMFQGLRSLHDADFGENSITEVPDRVFEFSLHLKKLNFTKNSIKLLHADSFYNLVVLEELDLSYNYLRRISPLVFQYLKGLVNLQLGSNTIEQLDADKWSNLTKLQVLNVSSNDLISFDLSNPFSFSTSLMELHLDNNNLIKLNAPALRKHLSHLKLIDLSENPWACEDLVPVMHILSDSHIDYKKSQIDTEPNVGGISCNQSLETYKKQEWSNPRGDTTTSTTTSTAKPPVSNGLNIEDAAVSLLNLTRLAHLQMKESVDNLHKLIVWLFVVVIVFMCIDITVRTHCLNKLSDFISRRSRGAGYLDNDVEMSPTDRLL